LISHEALQLGLRTKALTLSVATTGSTTLSATSTGYARASGSFVTDGFKPGMELSASGFTTAANNGVHVIVAVSALAIQCEDTATEAAASGRTLSVGLPSRVAWENVAFDPPAGAPWVEEQLVPAPSRLLSVSRGTVETTALYNLLIYTPEDVGVGAANGYADALIVLFAPLTDITLSTGHVARVRTDTGPYRGQMIRRKPGWVTVPVTFPLFVYTSNPN
jgi:hypothetical protein